MRHRSAVGRPDGAFSSAVRPRAAWGNYGGRGGSQRLRQTALNAGYNNGIQGRR